MTTTQAICESMGWKYDESGWVFDKNDHVIGDWEFVKALQARLVEEGWNIFNAQLTAAERKEIGFVNEFECYASRPGKTHEYLVYTDSEPAAIVALYCKVKGIEVEHE
jgi:hypothetical protein